MTFVGFPHVSGVLRWCSSTSWMTVEDAGHESRGIASIELRADRVRVHYSFTAVSVSSVQLSVDDEFAAANVRVGHSVGLSYTDVYFYMGSSSARVNPALLTRAGANVFFTGWFNLAPVCECVDGGVECCEVTETVKCQQVG